MTVSEIYHNPGVLNSTAENWKNAEALLKVGGESVVHCHGKFDRCNSVCRMYVVDFHDDDEYSHLPQTMVS